MFGFLLHFSRPVVERAVNPPILYSFRRCPYCIRANMALWYSGVNLTLRDVELRNLPTEVLSASPEKTVPVLRFSNDQVMTESWDIIKWALDQNDPNNWLGEGQCHLPKAEALIEINDGWFKESLDKYKYATSFPEHPEIFYRQQCEKFLGQLEENLGKQSYLLSDEPTVADVAIFPFIRQFSMVDQQWFKLSEYGGIRTWLNEMLNTPCFIQAFTKRPIWVSGTE